MNFEKKPEPYNIGLDIGTDSVGWAVTDENFKIIRKGNKRKALWGVLLFEEAKTAADRRGYRSIRRRYARRRERINLLQDIFRDEIERVDKDFYTKLNESFFLDCDTLNKTRPLTKEEKEELKNYQNKYPTIYHLRKELLTTKEKMDIRLVYMAIHHIIKYRGNFNYNIENFEIDKINLKELLSNVFNSMFELLNDIYITPEPTIDLINLDEIETILLSPNKRENKKNLENIFQNVFQKKVSTELANALIGYTINLENLFLIDLEENVKIDFKLPDFEDKITKLENELGEKIEIITELKNLYDAIDLKIIFKNEDSCSISNLMVKYYNIHKEDLHLLKNLFRPYRNYYKSFFKDKINNNKEELCIYTKYVRNNINYTDFANEIKKVFEKIKSPDNEKTIDAILERIDNQSFIPRITDTSNGKYPYQINAYELKKIIENQGNYYSFLKDEVNGELKLLTLLKFRIPYYVGPLVAKEKSKFAWMERKQNGKITPFNFDQMVDKRLSAKNFILKMIGHCTYLLNEYSMPTNSILYSRFKVLNELKQIKINDQPLNENLAFLKQIYEEFFLTTPGSLTNSKFVNYLTSKTELSMYTDNEFTDIKVTGYSADNKFANTMTSYIDFFGPNGIFEGTNYTEKDADEIIKLITIFEDKEILKEEVLELYPNLAPKINKIVNKKYKGWSGLSEKLLTTKYYLNEETNLKMSIMDLMYETRENFMQILNNSKYGFWNMINEENQVEDNVVSYDLVNELATSPAVKKGIWQTIKVLEEIISYMGYEPANITIEMARSNETKKRTIDRKKQLLNIYEKFKSEINDYNVLSSELKSKEKIDSEKLFLYFIQEGKSLYSKTPLDISNLSNYEVDHILPQTLIKDDSIDNKALVLKEENQMKRDNLVLPSAFRNENMKKWWSHLRKINLISNKKYQNLIRDSFRDKDIEGFINRQLVETRQVTKHVANIIKNIYKNTNVIYLKANISHNYRERFKLYKYRELNDYHHAHDAYLASVLGIYQSKYLKTKINKFELKELINDLIKEKRYEELKYGYIINSIDQDFVKINKDTGEVALNIKDFTETIENTLYRNDILISKKTEIKTGEFYNETKNKKGMKGVPLKKNFNTEWYGSYTRLNPAYAIVVRYQQKNNYLTKMIGIPIYILAKNDKTELNNYIKNLLKLENESEFEIIKDKIPFYTILNWEGQICALVGASDKVEVCNAKEFNLERNNQIKWKYTLNRLFNDKKDAIDDINYNIQLSDILLYVVKKIETEYNLYFNLIPELKSYINEISVSNMTFEVKEKVLKELFKLLKFNSMCANLKFLNEKASSAFGKKNERIITNAIIIKKSVTGLKEYYDEF